MDKFLLAYNPLRPANSAEFIIHTLEPVMIITCTQGHVDVKDERSRHYQFADARLKDHLWTLSVYHSEGTANLEKENAIIDRAWRWFRSYLESQL